MIEQRQSLLEFPCRFPIKAFGRHASGFEDTVYQLVKTHVPELTVDDISSRGSSGGRYLAVTAEITAHSQSQLDAIYADLTASDSVLISL